MQLSYQSLQITYPAREPPAWAGKVERWYQLDPFAYALPEAFSQWGLTELPAQMFLACPNGSNFTDHAFTKTGAESPTKFVHTLPNVRASSLLSVMAWNGPVFSLHKDPFTLALALREALTKKSTWVWAISEKYRVHLWQMGMGEFTGIYGSESFAEPNDQGILRWFEELKPGRLALGGRWEIIRQGRG